jgi:2-dehydro-3-deoxy-D-arabinonate dehydratase
MRYYRTVSDGASSLVVERDGAYYDASTIDEGLRSYSDLVLASKTSDMNIEELTERVCSNARPVSEDRVEREIRTPVTMDEVWAAGVTYEISTESREGEGRISDTYLNAYEADRPEIYFKATPSRTVGHGEAIGVRSDSEWDVPEPELAIVLHRGDIVGYTVGNDVCSRDIERENLLYLPQSKIYSRCCAVGPCIARVDDPHALEMSMRIERDGATVFEGTTNTEQMVRSCEELVSYFVRSNEVPEVSVLLTGTSLVPPDDVSLKPDDIVSIEIEGIGTLRNPVQSV